ncbi:thiamine pyrophosphokinase [Bacillus mesophilus]|uniref:Thiamine diphosphokinase n=1 Tax=Bacillus mesophilus TaxID=1808955 RepID=A0A6M0Q3E6_9BACI|nr:thiamine diphosphokinase [Bacillus mesophilus]MBM7659406.1 thiamine pyrophosphokinase [Bacillus mesophilus]NEY70279.1 thiamine diphosphokinase [Bacillus mesophilus]
MIIHIVAGGPLPLIPNLTQYVSDSCIWVGVDRGLFYILKQGIKASAGIGDFDSVSEEELQWMQEQCENFSIAPAEKDQTDLELALDWALEQKPKKIRIFGATGGRLDHALGSIQLLTKGFSQSVQMEMIDKQNIVSLLKPGTYQIQRNLSYTYISFLPLSREVKGLTLSRDFKYPLVNGDILWGTSLCVSNQLIAETGTFSFNHGIVIMVKSKD